MHFDLKNFFERAKNFGRNQQDIIDYERYFGLPDRIEEFKWYSDYVCHFQIPQNFEFEVPQNLKQDFDWILLLQLLAASFSNEYELFVNSERKCQLIIKVVSGSQRVEKNSNMLFPFQVIRLFEIYISEQMCLELLSHEEETEKIVIQETRKKKISDFRIIMDQVNKEMKAISLLKDLGLEDIL